MTETLNPDTLPLPSLPDGEQPADVDPNPGPATANPDGPSPMAELVDAPLVREAGNGYVNQSREAFRDVQEQGKAALRHVGATAVKPFTRFRRGRQAEATDGGEATSESVAQTRKTWRERATGAKNRAGHRLEERWENRRQEQETARNQRRSDRAQRLNERKERKDQKKEDRENEKRQADIDRRTDRLDNQIHKATMSRKEFRNYRYQKQARKDRERDVKMWQDWRDQQAAKQARKDDKARSKRVDAYLREHEAKEKAEQKAARKGAKQAARAEGKAYKANERYDEGQARAEELRSNAKRLEELRADPEAYAEFLQKEKEAKELRRKARVQKAGKVGKAVLRGANVATKVAVGAGVIGGELAAKHARGAAKEIQNDERVQYARVRAKAGMTVMRRTVSSMLVAAGEKLLPTDAELEEVVKTGEFQVAAGAEVEIDLHAEAAESAEGKTEA